MRHIKAEYPVTWGWALHLALVQDPPQDVGELGLALLVLAVQLQPRVEAHM